MVPARQQRTAKQVAKFKFIIWRCYLLLITELFAGIQCAIHLAILTYGFPTNFVPNSSHVGANLLQWPHLKQKQGSYRYGTLLQNDISCNGYLILSKVKSRNILSKDVK